MERRAFTVTTGSGDLTGLLTGTGPRVLALHGGPGMGFDYLDDAVAELATRYQVASFQQRGLSPSTHDGEFTVAEAVADIVAVLDRLDWDTAYLMGHSWGGHLAFHAAVSIPERLAGVLSVDPLGAVGDGGAEAFAAEMLARLPEAARARAHALDEKDNRGESTQEEDLEAFTLFWPAYFADPSAAPPMPHVEFSQPAGRGLWADLIARLPELESSLPSITVPVGVVVGELSPMPPSAGTASAERIPGAWSRTVRGAGHFVWFEAPGCLLDAMDRLVAPGAGQATPSGAQDPGPFFHGTKVELRQGDLLAPGHSSNFGDRTTANFVYLTATLDAATWGAELATGEGRGRIYRVEPTGPFEDDPNLTDQRFPGNPTRSYRTRDPLRVVGEVPDWEPHPPELLQHMRDHLEELQRLGVQAIND